MLTPLRVLGVGVVAALSTGLLVVTMSTPSSAPAGGPGGTTASPTAPREGGPSIAWSTVCVSLSADWMRIRPDVRGDDPGLVFTAGSEVVALNSDPGGETYRTLEATRMEHGSEMRLNLYLKADAERWWVSELRTYDGQPTPDWITYPGPLFETPLGEAYEDDVTLHSDQGNVPGAIEIRGLRLAVPDFGTGSGPTTCMVSYPISNVAVGTVVESSPAAGGPVARQAASPAADANVPDPLSPAVRAALEVVSARLLDDCFEPDEAVALVSTALLEAGSGGFFVRTDGPIGGPSDRIDEIMAHVEAGCAIYGGSGATEDGTPVFYVGDGTGEPTSTFVPLPTAD